MNGAYIGFVMWLLCGLLFLGIGIYDFFSKKQVGFWANAESPKMEDVKAHNRAVGILWCIYAVVFIVLGLPLLLPQPSAIVVISALGVVFETIVLMAIYARIEQKYRKK